MRTLILFYIAALSACSTGKHVYIDSSANSTVMVSDKKYKPMEKIAVDDCNQYVITVINNKSYFIKYISISSCDIARDTIITVKN